MQWSFDDRSGQGYWLIWCYAIHQRNVCIQGVSFRHKSIFMLNIQERAYFRMLYSNSASATQSFHVFACTWYVELVENRHHSQFAYTQSICQIGSARCESFSIQWTYFTQHIYHIAYIANFTCYQWLLVGKNGMSNFWPLMIAGKSDEEIRLVVFSCIGYCIVFNYSNYYYFYYCILKVFLYISWAWNEGWW